MTIPPHGMAGGEGEVTARAEPQRQRQANQDVRRNPSISTCRVSCTPRARLRLEGDALLGVTTPADGPRLACPPCRRTAPPPGGPWHAPRTPLGGRQSRRGPSRG